MRFFQRLKSLRKQRVVARRRLMFEPLETRNLMALDLAAIGGTAFVDLTGNGLTPDDTRVPGATVELYRDDGDGLFNAGTDTLLGTTTTDSSGVYRFASTSAGGVLPAGTLTADDYFVRQLALTGFSPPAAAPVTLTATQMDGTTVQTVDSFDTTQQVVTANSGTPLATSSLTAPEVIGEERDVAVTFISGDGDVSVQIDMGGTNLLAFASGLFVVGSAVLQYDGADGSATALAATGLGAVSLSGGDANAGVLLATRGDKPGSTAQVRIYSNATNYSTATISIPNQISVEDLFVSFGDFVADGGAGADFTSVGAIEVTINGVIELDALVTVLATLRPNEVTSNLQNTAPSIAITKFTNGVDANTAETGPLLAIGATATFTYSVTSTGGTALENVVVTDDNGTPGSTADDFNPTFAGGDTNGNTILDLGETWTYSATHTVTAGQYTNIATATAEDPAGTPVTDSDPSNHFGVEAGVALVKSTNGQDANTAPGPFLGVGSTATFTYVVTNPGNVALGSVVVTDDNGTAGVTGDDFNPTLVSGDTNSNSRLDVTETWTYQATRTVTAGQYTNVATVTGNPVDSAGVDIAGINDATDTDPSNHFGVTAAINIVKSTNGNDANTAPGPNLAVGATATFTYVVTNTGNTPLASVVLSDDNGTPGNSADNITPTFQSGDTNSNGRLDTTETWTYQATRTVTAGQYTNTVTVTANPVDSSGNDITGITDVTDTDVSNHFGFSTGIALRKLTNGIDTGTGAGPSLSVGSTATFTYIVTNTGNTPVSDVVVTDDNGTPANTSDDFSPTFVGGDTDGDSLLDVTETWTYQATRVVTTGSYRNTATVTGDDIESELLTASDESAHEGILRLSKRRFLASTN